MRPLAAGMCVVAALVAGAPAASAQADPLRTLATLAVPRGQLGRIAQGLQVELQSGLTTNSRAADDSFDPNDNEASVTSAGRVGGYALLYGDAGWTALRRGSGVIEVGTSLDLFRSERQAFLYEAKSLRDLARVRGKSLNGVVVERANGFRVTGLGPGARGLEIVQRIGNRRVYSTVVDFQIARILCEAVINRADKVKARAPATAIAKTLRNRLAAYGQNQLNAQPVQLPRPLGTLKPGAHAPNLAAMVPTNEDLKGKAGVDQQAFVPDDLAITSYVRSYRFAPNSGLFSMRATAALQRTRREASGRLFVTRAIFTGREGALTLARMVATGPTLVRRDAARSAKLGDESFATAVTFTSNGERLRALLIYERRDRILGSLIVVGTAKKLTLQGAVPFGRALDRRIKSALHPGLVA